MTSATAKRKRRESVKGESTPTIDATSAQTPTNDKTDVNTGSDMQVDEQQQHSKKHATGDKLPKFKPLTVQQIQTANNASVYARIPVPPHRLTPLKQHWADLYKPIVEYMKLQIRYNIKKRCIELRVPGTVPQRQRNTVTTVGGEQSTDAATAISSEASAAPKQVSADTQTSLTRATDFIRAFLLGFELRDSIALLRLDDLFIDTFEIKDVKVLTGEHLSRAIGRIAGINGKTKYTIENSTKTRIVLADTYIHILGSYSNINIAKQAVVRLIMGSPPSKVYTQMRAVAARQKQRF